MGSIDRLLVWLTFTSSAAILLDTKSDLNSHHSLPCWKFSTFLYERGTSTMFFSGILVSWSLFLYERRNDWRHNPNRIR